MKVAEIIRRSALEGKEITAGEIIGFFENDDEKSKLAEIFSEKLPDADIDSLIKSSIEKVKLSKVNIKIKEMTEKMNEMYQAGEIDSANKIYVEIKDLQKKKR
jgi:hypothetical protein